MAARIGPELDVRADVPTIQFIYEHLDQEFPVSGDLIARATRSPKNVPASRRTKKTAKALDGPAVESHP